MKSINNAFNIITPYVYMASIDLKDEFYLYLYIILIKNEWMSHRYGPEIKIAAGHRTLSDKKRYMPGNHVWKLDILSCTLSLSIICGKSFKVKIV